MTEPENETAGTAASAPLPGGDFRLFVQKLGYQALIGLGALENPVTKTKRIDMAQARSVMDDLLMLQDNTRGNLEEEEEAHLRGVISDLERHYMQVSQNSPASCEP